MLNQLLDVINSIEKRSDEIFMSHVKILLEEFDIQYKIYTEKNKKNVKPDIITIEYANELKNYFKPLIAMFNNKNKEFIKLLNISIEYKEIIYPTDIHEENLFNKKVTMLRNYIFTISDLFNIYNKTSDENLKQQIVILIKQYIVYNILYLTGFSHLDKIYISINNNDKNGLKNNPIFNKCKINPEKYKIVQNIFPAFDQCILEHNCIGGQATIVNNNIKNLINKLEDMDSNDKQLEITEFAEITNGQLGKLIIDLEQTIRFFIG